MRYGKPSPCPLCGGRMRIRKHVVELCARIRVDELFCGRCGQGIRWQERIDFPDGHTVKLFDVRDGIRDWNRVHRSRLESRGPIMLGSPVGIRCPRVSQDF